MKTLTQLKNRPFYRFLEIIYLLTLVPIGYMTYMAYSEHEIVYLAWALGFLLVLEVLKRIIYYIFLGSFNPPK